jgi:hypothetical protein
VVALARVKHDLALYLARAGLLDRLGDDHVYYASPAHPEVPGQLFALSPPSLDVIHHFFTTQAGGYDVRRRLGEVAVPALVIAGGWGWVCPPAAARAIAAGVPDVELAILADTGHFSFSEDPARFHEVVGRFLDRSDRPKVPGRGDRRPWWRHGRWADDEVVRSKVRDHWVRRIDGDVHVGTMAADVPLVPGSTTPAGAGAIERQRRRVLALVRQDIRRRRWRRCAA